MKIKILVQKPDHLIYYIKYADYTQVIRFIGVWFCGEKKLYIQKDEFELKSTKLNCKNFEKWIE